jgi:hypothetical protein
VEAGSNTSTVALRFVEGESETVKYGRKSQGSRTRECADEDQQQLQPTDLSSRQRERPTSTTLQLSDSNKNLVVSPRWVLYSKIDWPTDRRSQHKTRKTRTRTRTRTVRDSLVEAGSNSSTVAPRTAGGDKKGSLESETVKYCRQSHGTRIGEWMRWQGPAAIVNDRHYDRRCSIEKKILAVSLKRLGAKTNWLAVNRQS